MSIENLHWIYCYKQKLFFFLNKKKITSYEYLIFFCENFLEFHREVFLKEWNFKRFMFEFLF